MKIYVIVNELKNICYVIANNIESAMKEYKKKYESNIVEINLLSQNVIVGDENE